MHEVTGLKAAAKADAYNGDILQVRDLSTHFYTDEGVVRVVDNVSFSVVAGETVGIVGESGSGKTVAALSLMRLI